MSGICGVIHFDGHPELSDILSSMVSAAPYRGPDGVHTWEADGAAVSHQALHVTPEDEQENQPLVEGGIVLVADARIDNRSELRSTLQTFLRDSTPTDADLILASYRRWGDDCVRHLIGDFAFAIWDVRERRLFAARDPMGMRALYYRSEPARLLFATEVKQILAVPGVPRRLRESMVAAYLLNHSGDIPWTTWTFYEGVFQVPPAHALVVQDGVCRTWEYWDLDLDAPIRYASDQEYIEHFRSLYVEAVRCRLRSVRPVSALLSGGLDSGSTVSVAARLIADASNSGSIAPEIRPISWAFPTLTECDERNISRHVTEHFGLSATDLDVEAIPLLGAGRYQQLDADEPFAEGFYAQLNASFAVAREQGGRLLLSGFRGDLVTGEWLFDYVGMLRRGQWLSLWGDLRAHSRQSGQSLGALLRYYFRPSVQALWPEGHLPRARAALRDVWHTLAPAAQPPDERHDWISIDLHDYPELRIQHEEPSPSTTTSTQQRRYEGLRLSRAARAASWLERLGARAGVSHADPWSDCRLAQFAVSVPPRVLCRAGTNKHIVREAMQGWIPGAAMQRMRKIYPKALHERALKDTNRDVVQTLITGAIGERREYVRGSALQAYYEAYRKGGEEDPRFWRFLTLEQWLRQHHAVPQSRNVS